jgi:capsular exopolysaccharide synthesis family protein
MSRIFDALRKSEQEVDKHPTSPQPVRQPLDEVPGPQSVAIERVQISPETRVIVHTRPGSLGADRFRLLRTRLTELISKAKRKTLLVTSAVPQDGKSTVALNLATALAEHGKRHVLLLEADFYRPSLCRVLGIRPGPGLAECLRGDADPVAALRRIEPLGCYFLPAGKAVSDPAELVQSGRFSPLVAMFEARFDWILVDSPPVAPVADLLALRAQAYGCLLVVRAGQTTRETVEEAVRQLGREHVLAIVLNGVEGLDRHYSKYYGKYYGGGSRNGSGPGKTPALQTE